MILVKNFMKQQLTLKNNKTSIDDLKNLFKKVYGDKIFKERFDKLKADELIKRAINLRDGVPFATPVFDGAKGVRY